MTMGSPSRYFLMQSLFFVLLLVLLLLCFCFMFLHCYLNWYCHYCSFCRLLLSLLFTPYLAHFHSPYIVNNYRTFIPWLFYCKYSLCCYFYWYCFHYYYLCCCVTIILLFLTLYHQVPPNTWGITWGTTHAAAGRCWHTKGQWGTTEFKGRGGVMWLWWWRGNGCWR